MKKLLVTLAAVLVSVSSFAQGTLTFNNRNLTGPNNTTYNAPINGVNNPANTTAQLFLVGAGGALTALTPINTFRAAPNSQFLTGPVTVTVPGQPAGTTGLNFVVRAWEGASYDTATVKGQSAQFTVGALGGTTAAGQIFLPPDLGGPGGVGGLPAIGFTLVPEPSTIALGLLGAAALLYRRRK
jgi:hypothetical protein